MPWNCHCLFMLLSHKHCTRWAPTQEKEPLNGYSDDTLPQDTAGHVHRHTGRPRDLSRHPSILQPHTLFVVSDDARMVRQGCVGLRFRCSELQPELRAAGRLTAMAGVTRKVLCTRMRL